MAAGALAHRTRISTWGNSEAVRIPRKILTALGIGAGDSVDVVVNERNNIEIIREKATDHRRVNPAPGITYETLFAGFNPINSPADPWADLEPIGAEIEAWS